MVHVHNVAHCALRELGAFDLLWNNFLRSKYAVIFYHLRTYTFYHLRTYAFFRDYDLSTLRNVKFMTPIFAVTTVTEKADELWVFSCF